ncbi:cytochrome P450 4V2-like [Mya arenaria]|uniref:cytochrome P450 4V2-like n=1 Tax=Mya arenaria TaxID=6604 RepID=UPI0022E608FD|nr:cytochrome P450 4V2-like [Mya arenaria]
MVAVWVVLFTVAVVLLTLWILKQERRRKRIDKLAGPRSLPLIGNLHQLKRDPKEFTIQLYEFCKEYAKFDVFRLMVAHHPLILVCSPDEIEPLMNSSKHLDKSSDYDFLHSWLGTGLLTSTGEKWKMRRKLLTPTFHFKILHDFIGVFSDQSNILIEKMRAVADGKTTVDVFNDITLCALDIICETAMGRSVNAQKNSDSDYVRSVYKASEFTFIRQRSPWLWPDLLFNLIGPGKDYAKSLKILHGFTEKVIRERQEEFSKKYTSDTTMEQLLEKKDHDKMEGKQRLAFLDMLLCATSDGEHMSFLDIREEVDTFMFEGHDTTAMAANWALHLIGTDPEVQKKVHQELDAVFGRSNRDAMMDDLKELKYLECCIKEALRLFPSVPVFGRSLTEDTTIGGVFLGKGTSALIVPAAIHMRDDIYPDPDKFDPDRFLTENSVKRHPYAYIPFSAGSRNCIGQKFAMLEEKVILSTIFRNFSVKSMQDREELCPLAELILRPGNGIKVVLTPK